MKARTEAQKIVLDVIRRLQTAAGRAVLLREIAQDMGRPLPSIHTAVQGLVQDGLLTRGKGRRGVQVAEMDMRYRAGWTDAVQHLEPVVGLQLLEHHASAALTEAVAQTFADAQEAMPEDVR